MSSEAARVDPARYVLLASAVAGRAVQVEAAPTGEPSFTDGRTIYVTLGSQVNGSWTTIDYTYKAK